MFDTHLHTKFSSDSEMEIEDAIKSADNKNMSLIITEHMDLNYPKKGLFYFDPAEYFKKYSKYRRDNLLLGIEIGMKEDSIEESRKIVNNNLFDYVIGSIHLVDNLDIYYDEYYKGKSKKEAYERYLIDMLNSVKHYEFIDSMGHIDYICRYAKYEDKELYYKEHSDIIDEILRTLVDNDKCMELNGRRLNEENAVKNLIPIYKRYRELGGKNITIGSDAHNTLAIGSNFNIAKEIAEICNLKTVYFKNRKIEYEKN